MSVGDPRRARGEPSIVDPPRAIMKVQLRPLFYVNGLVLGSGVLAPLGNTVVLRRKILFEASQGYRTPPPHYTKHYPPT